MENIMQEALAAIQDGAGFKVNFQERTFSLNGKDIVKNGEYEGNLGTSEKCEDFIEHLESLYDRYVHSVPTAKDNTKGKRYFIAKPEHLLDMEDMMYGERRPEARFKLEFTLLAYILSGRVDWDIFTKGHTNKWFWQSTKYPTFIILKHWVTNSK